MSEARALLDLQISERDFQQQVVDLARLHGWMVYHTHNSRRSEKGFPDLTLVRRDRLMFVELKTETGEVTPEQHAWLDALEWTGRVDVRVWRPRDWTEIEDSLR